MALSSHDEENEASRRMAYCESAMMVNGGGGSSAPQTGNTTPSTSTSSHMFQLFTALDAKEETEKVRLAQIIHDLHTLAREEEETKTRERQKQPQQQPKHGGGLRRYVTMVRAPALLSKKNNHYAEHQQHHPDIGDRISLQGVDLSQLSHEDATYLVEGLAAGSKFDLPSLQSLLTASTALLQTEPNLIDLSHRSEPVAVVGDLHGSLDSLTHILQKIDAHKQVVVFDGDFVDRGDHSLEVLVTLLILKLAYPNNVYLIRGNHEDSMVASVYGFRDEIRRKYGQTATMEIWDSIAKSFAALPLALRTKTALVVHGGIPTADFNLENLVKFPKTARFSMPTIVNPATPDEEFVAGIVWSDPHPSDAHVVERNPRGVGIVFGSQVAQDFLKRNHLKYLVRGHEVVENGVRDMKCGDGKSVITVFSAAAYPGNTGTNKGAFLHLHEDGRLVEECYSVQDISASHEQAMKESTEHALVKVRSIIGCNRSKLEKAFAKVQKGGKVTIEEWVRVMAETVSSAGMPWVTLQPILAPASCFFGTIDVATFLKSHSFKIHGSSDLKHHDAETLAENHEMLLTVFKFLDIDGDGTLSQTEFRTGVNLLNKRLPPERQLQNPDELFKSLDTDGNGEISFEEFTHGFGMA
eukprot:scaffold294_cov221-Amphora_coffeaeformis.AAC.8